MKLRILLATVLTAGLAFVWATAAAKAPFDVTISGPGLTSPIRLSEISANELARNSAFFGQTSDRVTADRPAGALGPRYAATYRWSLGQRAPSVLRQDLYPFADAGPLSYTPPGQRVGERRRTGGWSRAGPQLTMLLVAAGVPIPPSYVVPVPLVEAPRLTG
jgi:hypothetical protein